MYIHTMRGDAPGPSEQHQWWHKPADILFNILHPPHQAGSNYLSRHLKCSSSLEAALMPAPSLFSKSVTSGWDAESPGHVNLTSWLSSSCQPSTEATSVLETRPDWTGTLHLMILSFFGTSCCDHFFHNTLRNVCNPTVQLRRVVFFLSHAF